MLTPGRFLYCDSVPSISSLSFDNSYARLSPEFYEVVDPTPLPGLSLVAFNPDAAQLISRYKLDKPTGAQDGINTRLMRKRDGKWVIALNHVSSIEPAQ